MRQEGREWEGHIEICLRTLKKIVPQTNRQTNKQTEKLLTEPSKSDAEIVSASNKTDKQTDKWTQIQYPLLWQG